MLSRAILMLAASALALYCSDAQAAAKKRGPPKPRISGILLGSEEALAAENRAADAAGLPRLKNGAELEKLVESGALLPVEDATAYFLDEELGEEDPDRAELYAHARPWLKLFLDDILGEAHKLFGAPFAVTSLVRTEDYQFDLKSHNRAAASMKNKDSRSTHLTGATVDISLEGVPWKTKQWLRKRLIALERAGLVHATEERAQKCLHIFVAPNYAKDK